jgi:hypothetical protein
MLRIQSEERQVAELRFAPEQFAGQVKIDAAALEKYYEENKQRFEIPEQAKADYVVLSLEALMDKLTVSDGEVSAWYDGHKDRYQTGRRAAREPHPDPRRRGPGRGKRPKPKRMAFSGSFRSRRASSPNWPNSIRRIRALRKKAAISASLAAA